jgi:hypothetical protein
MHFIRPYLPLLKGLALAVAIYLLVSWLLERSARRGTKGEIRRFLGAPDDAADLPFEVGSDVHKIRLAFAKLNLDVSGWENTALWMARAAITLSIIGVLAILGMPVFVMVAGPVAAWFVFQSYVDGVWAEYVQAINQELPTFLARMAAFTQVDPNVLNALEETAETLDPEGPLSQWVLRLASQLTTGGRAALRPMMEEAHAITPSLGLAVFQIGRLWETGGTGYSQAFAIAADQQGEILSTQAKAYAKGQGARGTVKIVAGALILIVLAFLRNPLTGEIIRSNPFNQMVYAVAFVMMAIGWWYINEYIKDAMQ